MRIIYKTKSIVLTMGDGDDGSNDGDYGDNYDSGDDGNGYGNDTSVIVL